MDMKNLSSWFYGVSTEENQEYKECWLQNKYPNITVTILVMVWEIA